MTTDTTIPHVFLRTLYVQQQGGHLRKMDDYLLVESDQQLLLKIPVSNIDQVCVLGNVQVTTPTICFCAEKNISIHFMSEMGKPNAVAKPAGCSDWQTHRLQIRIYENDEVRLNFAKIIIAQKIYNGIVLLAQAYRNHPETEELCYIIHYLKRYVASIVDVPNIDSLRGFEGNAASIYFAGLALCFRNPLFTFEGRMKHPAPDPINSLLSFGYTLLLNRIEGNMCLHGIDPDIGLMHESRGYAAFACDIIEEFRAPIVDALVLRMLNNRMLAPQDFKIEDDACFLNDDARKKFIQTFEQKLSETQKYADYVTPLDWRKIIDVQIRKLKRFILGKDLEYEPFEAK